MPKPRLQGVRMDFRGVWQCLSPQPAVPWELAGWPSALGHSCTCSVPHSQSVLLLLCPSFHSLIHLFIPLLKQAYDPFTNGFSHSFCVNLVLPSNIVHLFLLPFACTSFICCVLSGSFVHLAAHSVHRLFIHVFIHSVIGSSIHLLTKVFLQVGLHPFTVPLFIPGFAHSFIFFFIHQTCPVCS